MLATNRPEIAELLATLKRTWIAANPMYEEVEGIVAGTPSLARYDVIVQAFGEVLPDPGFLLAAAQTFKQYVDELAASADAWVPTTSDAFTALVVMVPTMGKYFGQWKESRFVAGETSTAPAFNVVSRLSDINDILETRRPAPPRGDHR